MQRFLLRAPVLWAAGTTLAVAFAVVILIALDEGPERTTSPTSAGGVPASEAKKVATPVESAPGGVIADCSMRSEAAFPGAFADPRNLVVGPLTFVGGNVPTSPSVIRGVGGQKFPLLVQAGHTVTVQVPLAVRSVAGLGYGPLPQGEVTLRDAHHTVTFVSCRRGEPSGSSANGPVTFWSGFVVTNVPKCVPLDLYLDDDPSPRRVVLSLGAACPAI
jgi:hypothetical protein